MKILPRLALLAVALAPLGAVRAVRAQDTSATTRTAEVVTNTLPVDRIVGVVGTHPILWSDVLEEINNRRAQGMQVPEDTVAQMALAKTILEEMIDIEVMVQRARMDTSIVVEDADLQTTVDQQMKRIREQFKTDNELVQALKGGGFGSIEEYKRWLTEQSRRRALQERLVQKMQQTGKMVAVPVSEEDITEAFDRNKAQLPKRPATVTFRQLVIATQASEAAKKAAYAKAESVYKDLVTGGDFEQIAKRESQDSASAVIGGDLGWNRRGQMLTAFDEMMFALPPGQISPIVETTYGYHIIRVDRVQPAERKARHILIKPKYDSADVERARLRADSALAQWKQGVPFDTLVARFHDSASDEAKGVLEPFEREKLPESYQKAFEGKTNGDFAGPFSIDDRQRAVPKFVVAQMLNVATEGEYTIQDLRNQIRDQLAKEKSYRRLLDALRKETYVAVMLDNEGRSTALVP